MAQDSTNQSGLKRTLGPLMLWGLGVGYVISGMYFGWNLGLEQGGTYGMAIATVAITIMYLTFTFGYTELACAIPKAGGAYDYAARALGPDAGFIAGVAQIVEFVFAPPAIAFAIGDYMSVFLGEEAKLPVAIGAYFVFTAINIRGVELAAAFELIITLIAIAGLILFFSFAFGDFEFENLKKDPMPNGAMGIFAALPFAIWFYLAIEGVANVAEETINPQRNVLIGFGAAILTLVVLCGLTFFSTVGVDGWHSAVFPPGSSDTSDAPLPLALAKAVGESHWVHGAFTLIGLSGLIASFHGIILAAGRATFEFGRMGLAPKAIGKVHGKFRTPVNALIVNMLVGIGALLTGKTGDIIVIAAFGALTLYVISMISLFVLRSKEPNMERPFKVPLYPIFPAVALTIAAVSLVAMSFFNGWLALIYFSVMVLSFVLYKIVIRSDRA